MQSPQLLAHVAADLAHLELEPLGLDRVGEVLGLQPLVDPGQEVADILERVGLRVGRLGVGGALVVIGLWKLNGGPWLPGDVSLGWFCVVLGSFAILLPGALLLPGSWYLRAEPGGLTLCVFFRIRFYRWPDVRSITVAGVGTDRRVMVDFSGADQNVRTRAFSPRL